MKSILHTSFAAILMISITSNTAYASEEAKKNVRQSVSSDKPICSFNENSTLTLNLNTIVDLAAKAKEQVKKYEDEVTLYAKQAKVENIELTRMNFSLNSNNRYQQNIDKSTYQLTGSIGFKISPYEKALIVLDQLKDKGYQVSLNVSSYKNNC